MKSENEVAAAEKDRLDFLSAIVAKDLEEGRHREVVTRFPPEPNGFLHIGHVKSIALNFGIAERFSGRCNLRMDDTNPETEEARYVDSIRELVVWLGYPVEENFFYASDYFEAMYEIACHLIREGHAYVDSSSGEEIRTNRGTVMEAGKPGLYRSRFPEESLDLFRRMREGEFGDGTHVLRARISLDSANMLMRDPILYRIRHAEHYRRGSEWCIYPLYDFAHPIEDALEGVTHSFCTLEFENNREFYEWLIARLPEKSFREGVRPRQYEFARLAIDHTVMSKRKLLELVREGVVDGWDDPRLPTIAGLRRRGVAPEALREFVEMVGVSRTNSRLDAGKLDFAIRDQLNRTSPRVMAVTRPLKVTITNYPEGEGEVLDAPLYPHDVPLEGSRPLPFGREIFIERTDFMEEPVKGYFRLSPGAEVRLRYAYLLRCTEVVKDEAGEVVELRCTYDPESRGGTAPDGRKVKGTIHWVSAEHALPCEVRLYEPLFTVPDPEAGEGDFRESLNPESKVVVEGALVEPWVGEHAAGSRYQFERTGYFASDLVDSRPGHLVFNRTVGLRDSWAKAKG